VTNLAARALTVLLLVRLIVAVVVLCLAAVVSIASYLAVSLRNHVMRTALLLMPAGERPHRFFTRVVEHYCDGVCWRCGATGPTADDLEQP
jgi:uncharacterized membrane protein YjgN (DUF898 family)